MLTKEQCDELERTKVNPLTRRKLKSEKGVFRKLMKECNDTPEITKADCVKFMANQRINPKTGRRIAQGKKVYMKFMAACEHFRVTAGSGIDNILQDLDKTCFNDADPILLEEFKDMSLDELKTIVKIGKGERKNCYLVDTILQHHSEHVKTGKNTRDPMNPSYVLTPSEIADIKRIKRNIDPSWMSPKRAVIPQYRGLNLVFTPTVGRTRTGAIVPLLHIWVVRTSNDETLFNLGYFPNDIEAHHTGSVDYTTSVAMYLVRRLWEQRKLLFGDAEPYRCCTVHLRKGKDYWVDVPQAEMIRKFKNMIDEFTATL